MADEFSFQVAGFTPAQCRAAAALHVRRIPAGFLSSLGQSVLWRIFAALGAHPQSILVLAWRGDHLCGFVTGSTDARGLYGRFLVRHGLAAAWAAVPALRSPRTIRGIVETLTYPARGLPADLPGPELMDLAVAEEYAGRGLAQALFAHFLGEMRTRGVAAFRVGTGAELVRAQRFYEKLGAERIAEVELHRGARSVYYRFHVPPADGNGSAPSPGTASAADPCAVAPDDGGARLSGGTPSAARAGGDGSTPPAEEIEAHGAGAGPAAATEDPVRDTRVRRDMLVNLLLSLTTAAAALLVVRFGARALAPASLGLFMLVRRLGDTSSSFLQLGTVYSVRRYISVEADPSRQFLHVLVGVAVYALVVPLVILVAIGAREPLARWVLNDTAGARDLVPWLGALVAALVLHYLASSLLFALRRIVLYNLLQIANTGVWYIAGFLLWGTAATVRQLIELQALASALLCVLIVAAVVRAYLHAGVHGVTLARFRVAARESFTFGLPRAVSPALEMALLLIGPWLVRADLAVAGYVLIALTLLRFAQAVIQPAANVFAIRAAGMAGRRQHASVRAGLSALLLATMTAAALSVAIAVPWVRLLLTVWLGPALARGVAPYAWGLLACMVPFAVFQALKEPVEMIWQRPRNLVTMGAVLACFVAVYRLAVFGVSPSAAIVLAYIVSMSLSGALSVYWARKYLREPAYFGVGRVTLIALVIMAANFGVQRIAADWPVPAQLVLAGVLAVLSIAAFAGAVARVLQVPALADMLASNLPRRRGVARRPLRPYSLPSQDLPA